jgi:antitoxin component HigA of HigAB toxin-antitoxin module
MAINFNDYLKENYSDSEISTIRSKAKEKGKMLIELQSSVSNAISEFAKVNNHTFTDIMNGLHTSKSQTSRIIKGESNFTLETLLKIYEYTGKKPRIIFE